MKIKHKLKLSIASFLEQLLNSAAKNRNAELKLTRFNNWTTELS